MPYYLRKCLKLYVSQTRKLSRYLLLTVNVSSLGLVSILTSIFSLQDPLQCLKSLFGVHSASFLSYLKKGKLAKMTTHCHSVSLVFICCHSLPFAVTCCHSLSLVVRLHVIRFHSLSIVVTRCNSMYHSSGFLQTILL